LITRRVSGGSDTIDTISDVEIAVLVCDGVFDSGLASILDVLDTANAMAEQLTEAPRWNVTTIGFEPRVRTSAGHTVDCEPTTRAESVDLLIVPAVNERQPDALVEFVSGDRSLPARELIAKTRARGAAIASACAGTRPPPAAHHRPVPGDDLPPSRLRTGHHPAHTATPTHRQNHRSPTDRVTARRRTSPEPGAAGEGRAIDLCRVGAGGKDQ
jgi:hypothetical protein